MAKWFGVVGFVAGVVLTTVAGAALGSHAADPEPSEQVKHAAADAGVDPIQLAGAVNSVHVDPYVYLRSEGLLEHASTLPPPAPVLSTPPVLPAVSARVACIESKESGGANVANARGSGAGGVLQYMPSTFAAHAAEMGHPEYSLWNPAQARAVAAWDLAKGRRAQWTVGGC
jgi:hypothetical protein